MMRDIRVIFWKEWREILHPGGGMLQGGRTNLLLIVCVFGLLLPLQFGVQWVDSPLSMIAWTWVPLFLVTSVVTDSIAGERERHTLETLLASRLSDQAILFGKIAAAVSYGWGLTIGCLLTGLTLINIVYWRGAIIVYDLLSSLAIIALTFLVALIVTTGGSLVSLRSTGTKQAMQAVNITILLILYLPLLALEYMPVSWKETVMDLFQNAGPTIVLLIVGIVLVLVNIVFLKVATLRFRRDRLMSG